MDRRAFLFAGGVSLAALAGCLGTDAGDASGGGGAATDDGTEDPTAAAGTTVGTTATPDGTATGAPTTTATDTPSENSLRGHPAGQDLDVQPFLGPPPGESDAVIVAFEDPSCTTCRRFEEGTFPKIKSEWTDQGKATFVFRVFPNVYEWGRPATQALEATYAHSEDAFWALKSHYYARQGSFTVDNVLGRTETFLAENTDVDAATVVEEARAKKYDNAVAIDVAAAEAAAVWATPTAFLFRDGEFVTTATGAKSFSVYRAALGL